MAQPSFEPFELIPFGPDHKEGLIELIASCYADYGQEIELDTLDADLHDIENIYQKPGSMFWVLLDGSNLIGSCAIKRTNETECEIKRVFLYRDYRGRGLGKALSITAINWATEQGYQTLHIWSDILFETAHQMYRALGAKDTGEVRALGGINNVQEFYFRKAL